MFGRSKKTKSDISVQETALFGYAQERIKEKSKLYTHLIFYLVGCIFMIILNLLLGFGSDFKFLDLDWFVYGVLIWTFFIMIHGVRVLLFSNFMGKAWQEKQMAYLLEKQKAKIKEMEEKLSLEIPKEATSTKTVLLDKTQENNTNELENNN